MGSRESGRKAYAPRGKRAYGSHERHSPSNPWVYIRPKVGFRFRSERVFVPAAFPQPTSGHQSQQGNARSARGGAVPFRSELHGQDLLASLRSFGVWKRRHHHGQRLHRVRIRSGRQLQDLPGIQQAQRRPDAHRRHQSGERPFHSAPRRHHPPRHQAQQYSHQHAWHAHAFRFRHRGNDLRASRHRLHHRVGSAGSARKERRRQRILRYLFAGSNAVRHADGPVAI